MTKFWFTVGAQILNFVILVWLLKHFLYRPIQNAIDAREKRIADELAAADSSKKEAQALADALRIKEQKFDAERAALLTKAGAEAQADRARLLQEARKDADDWRAAQQAALRIERATLGNEIARLVTSEAVDIARKTLGDLAASGLEESIGDVFARRLQQLTAKQKETLAAALGSQAEPAVVRSRFDLPAASRARIQDALNRALAADVHLRFETAADGICGVELTANGQKLAWSVADYLKSLQRKMDALLDAADAPPPLPVPSPAASPASTAPRSAPPATAAPPAVPPANAAPPSAPPATAAPPTASPLAAPPLAVGPPAVAPPAGAPPPAMPASIAVPVAAAESAA
jgi:F-type H+-transporting ATPase subunit b